MSLNFGQNFLLSLNIQGGFFHIYGLETRKVNFVSVDFYMNICWQKKLVEGMQKNEFSLQNFWKAWGSRPWMNTMVLEPKLQDTRQF